MALSNLSLTYQQLGKWKEANQTINESLNLLIAEKKHLNNNESTRKL